MPDPETGTYQMKEDTVSKSAKVKSKSTKLKASCKRMSQTPWHAENNLKIWKQRLWPLKKDQIFCQKLKTSQFKSMVEECQVLGHHRWYHCSHHLGDRFGHLGTFDFQFIVLLKDKKKSK